MTYAFVWKKPVTFQVTLQVSDARDCKDHDVRARHSQAALSRSIFGVSILGERVTKDPVNLYSTEHTCFWLL